MTTRSDRVGVRHDDRTNLDAAAGVDEIRQTVGEILRRLDAVGTADVGGDDPARS